MSVINGLNINNDLLNLINSPSLAIWDFNYFFYKGYWSSLSSYLHIPHSSLIINSGLFSPSIWNWFIGLIFNNLIFFTAFALLSFYYCIYGVQMLSFTTNSTDLFSDFYSYLADADDEIGALDDILFIALYLLGLLSDFFIYYLYYVFCFEFNLNFDTFKLYFYYFYFNSNFYNVWFWFSFSSLCAWCW